MTNAAPPKTSGLPKFRGDNVPRPRTGRRWLPLAGDIILAAGMLVLDCIGVVAVFLLGIDYSGWKPFDPGSDNSGMSLTPNWLYVGIADGVILLTAALLYQLRAVASACLQVLAGIAVLVIGLAGAQIDEHRGARAHASVSGHLAPLTIPAGANTQ
ncbi:DUF6234 family protein [Streptomyces sp. NBC_01231]|nr:DUF6234 family protein [Streptomyces sp. NBC_01231]